MAYWSKKRTMEIWDAYNDKREKIGQYLVRGERIPSGLYHLCVNVLVRHEDGDVLFMKRSSQKELYPNYFEFGAGGSVLAGEDSLSAVLRELKEETGLDIQSPKLCGVKDWVNSDGSRYIVFLYTCNTFTGEIISSSEGKVSWVKREDFLKLKLSVDMDVLLRVFEDPELTEFYYQKVNEEWNIHLK